MKYFDQLVQDMIEDVDASATDCVTLKLTLPAKILMANSGQNKHWAKKAAEIKRVKRDTALICMAAMSGVTYPCPWQRAVALETYVWTSNAVRDERNATTSTKAIWDGIVDSGLLIDDDTKHLRHIPPIFKVDKTDPHLLIQIWNVTLMKGSE